MISFNRMRVSTRLIVAGVAVLLGLVLITVYTLIPVSYTHLDVYKRQDRRRGDGQSVSRD